MVKRSKNQIRREKAKQRKLEATSSASPAPMHQAVPKSEAPSEEPKDSAIEYSMEIDPENPLFEQFKSVIEKFTTDEQPQEVVKQEDNNKTDSEDSEDYDFEHEEEMTKKQLKRLNKVSISTLKSASKNPQVVEWSDVNAPYPYLLVSLKSSPNAVPVPSHWVSKRDFLATKRGIERQQFELPSYILATGIQDMRGNDDKSLRQAQRERVQPKMGKLDIDYQRLHDAFFKHQTKPFLTHFGDVYYEGRETVDVYDEDLNNVKPGRLSNRLRAALGLSNDKTPPPWIQAMKHNGKPPAYQNLIIPGVDIPYDNIGYLVDESELKAPKRTHQLWGHFEADSSSEDEEEVGEEESDEENDNRDEAENEIEASSENNDEVPGDVVIENKRNNGDSTQEQRNYNAKNATVSTKGADTTAPEPKKFKF